MSEKLMSIPLRDTLPIVCLRCPAADFETKLVDMYANDKLYSREVLLQCRNSALCRHLRKGRTTEEWLYTVKDGDDLIDIAHTLNVPVYAMEECNPGWNPLRPGDKLIIPRKEAY